MSKRHLTLALAILLPACQSRMERQRPSTAIEVLRLTDEEIAEIYRVPTD